MIRTRLFRIVVCLFVLFLLQASCLRNRPMPVDAGACPAAAFRWLTTPNRQERHLSRYDFLIRKYAKRIDMDWRLLASIIYHESKFNERALSPVGAKGLMQVMDIAAEHYGMPDADLFDPETNIRLGTLVFDDLESQFRQEGVNPDDLFRFALAAYNVGGGALARRRAQADSLGLDPNAWSDVAAVFDLQEHTTPAYIDAVEATYIRYCSRFQ